MGILQLKYNGKTYTSKRDIVSILRSLEFYWLLDSECEGADIEIEKNTIIWNNGDFLNGNWHYGIFKNGNFYGNWKNGIWENGNFDGTGKAV